MKMSKDSKIMFLCFVAFIITGAMVYFPAIGGDFLLDDIEQIALSTTIQSPLNIQKIWTSDYWENQINSGNYRPLLKQVWAIEVSLFDKNQKAPFILFNIFLHSLNAVLLIMICKKIGIGNIASYAACSIYFFHPVHSETIVNVVGQGELFASLTLLSAWLFLIKSHESNSHQNLFLSLSLIILIFSLWIKEQAMLFCVILFIFMLIKKYEIRKSILYLFIWSLCAFIYICVRIIILGAFGVDKIHLPIFFDSMLQQTSFMFYISGRYFALIFYPQNLSAQYEWIIPIWRSSIWGSGWTLLGIVVCILVALIFILMIFLKKKTSAFLLFSMCFMMLPFLHIMPIGSPFAERHLVLSFIFFTMILSEIYDWALRQYESAADKNIQRRLRFLGTVLISLSILTISGRTFLRAGDWRDGATLWEKEVLLSSENPVSNNNLAHYLLREGKVKEAKRYADAALTLFPTFADAHITRGEVAVLEGDFKRAESHFKYAIEFGKPPLKGHIAYAKFLFSVGRIQDSKIEIQKAKKYNPDADII